MDPDAALRLLKRRHELSAARQSWAAHRTVCAVCQNVSRLRKPACSIGRPLLYAVEYARRRVDQLLEPARTLTD